MLVLFLLRRADIEVEKDSLFQSEVCQYCLLLLTLQLVEAKLRLGVEAPLDDVIGIEKHVSRLHQFVLEI